MRTLSTIQSSLRLSCLLIVLSAIAASLPTQGAAVHRRQTTSRDQCKDTRGTCQFHTHCIESQFPCGHEGLILSYTNQRCKVIECLPIKTVGRCSSPPCVSKNTFRWAYKVEQCFQDSLLILLERYEGLHRDPQVCLRWEREAILELNKCYSLTSGVHQLSDNDIEVLFNLFHIGGEYYKTVVDTGLPKVVRDELAARLVPEAPMERLIFCVKADKYTILNVKEDLTLDDSIGVVQRALSAKGNNLPRSQFIYGGMDKIQEDRPCDAHQPSGINTGIDGFHLVTVFVANSSSIAELDRNTPVDWIQAGSFAIYATVYELTSKSKGTKPSRDTTECGDGRRQATEDCDYGGSDASGCSINCRVQDGYDCGTDRLQPSVCWEEVCGNGARTRGEECDDGNSKDGDGCDSSCQVEATHTCTQAYNVTSTCTLVSVQPSHQIAPVRRQTSITSIETPPPPFSSRVAAAFHEHSKRLLQSPQAAITAGSRSLAISLLVPCALALVASSSSQILFR